MAAAFPAGRNAINERPRPAGRPTGGSFAGAWASRSSTDRWIDVWQSTPPTGVIGQGWTQSHSLHVAPLPSMAPSDDNEVTRVRPRSRQHVHQLSEFRAAPSTPPRFRTIRALVAGALALFIGSVVYWQIWFWGDDGTSLPAVLAVAPLLLIAPEYVIGRWPAIVGMVAGAGVSVAAHLSVSSTSVDDGVYAALAPVVAAAASGWLVFCLISAGVPLLVARRA